MVNLFKYHDYRQYLRDLYDERKAQDSKFSFRFFSKQAGFSSPNYLKLVMDGERSLTQKSLVKFIKGLKLNKAEAEFFEHLVHYTQADNITDKNNYYMKLAESSQYIELHELEKSQLDFFSNWHVVALYELIDIKGFRFDPLWISCHMHPSITVSEARKAMTILLELDLIQIQADGTVKKEGNLRTEKDVVSLAAFRFQKVMIEKAQFALENDPAHLRDLSSLTVAVPKKRIDEVKTLMGNFRRQLHALLQDEQGDLVYQVNLQMFPLTQMPRRKK